MENLIVWLVMAFGVLPIVCEAITQVIGGSDLTRTLRNRIIDKEIPFLSELLRCKYCLSVWVSGFVSMVGWIALGLPIFTLTSLFFLFLLVFVVHRVSNVMHLVFDIVHEYRTYRWTTPM
jgi:phosphate/sulfate permease